MMFSIASEILSILGVSATAGMLPAAPGNGPCMALNTQYDCKGQPASHQHAIAINRLTRDS